MATRGHRAAEDPGDESVLDSLNELGLTLNQSRVYLALLRHGPSTATEIALRASVPRPKIYDVLQSLEGYGFCSQGTDRVARWTPVSAHIALPDFARSREQERRAQDRRDSELVEALAAELPEPTPVPSLQETPMIEALIGLPRISEAFEDLVREATRSLEITQAQPMVQAPERWNVLESEAIERGVDVRVLYTPEVASDARRYIGLVAAGGEGRISNNLALKLAISDGEVALVALRDPAFTSGDAGDGLMAIRIGQPDLIAPLQMLFRREWRYATPVGAE